jgi:CheY-like chemotaxis protein
MWTGGTAIILLEDDSNDAFFVRHSLEKAHIVNPLVTFQTGSAARQALGSRLGPPALFVMDVHLAAGETGIEFLRWLRQQPPPLGSTPVMMLSGSDNPGDRDEALSLGSIYFLQKPVTPATLTAAVQSLGFVITSLTGVTAKRTIQRRV